jgi:hypothetical protein
MSSPGSQLIEIKLASLRPLLRAKKMTGFYSGLPVIDMMLEEFVSRFGVAHTTQSTKDRVVQVIDRVTSVLGFCARINPLERSEKTAGGGGIDLSDMGHNFSRPHQPSASLFLRSRGYSQADCPNSIL